MFPCIYTFKNQETQLCSESMSSAWQHGHRAWFHWKQSEEAIGPAVSYRKLCHNHLAKPEALGFKHCMHQDLVTIILTNVNRKIVYVYAGMHVHVSNIDPRHEFILNVLSSNLLRLDRCLLTLHQL